MTQHTETATPRTDKAEYVASNGLKVVPSRVSREMEEELAALQAAFDERTSHVIVSQGGQALACSESVAMAFDTLRTQLAQAQDEWRVHSCCARRLHTDHQSCHCSHDRWTHRHER